MASSLYQESVEASKTPEQEKEELGVDTEDRGGTQKTIDNLKGKVKEQQVIIAELDKKIIELQNKLKLKIKEGKELAQELANAKQELENAKQELEEELTKMKKDKIEAELELRKLKSGIDEEFQTEMQMKMNKLDEKISEWRSNQEKQCGEVMNEIKGMLTKVQRDIQQLKEEKKSSEAEKSKSTVESSDLAKLISDKINDELSNNLSRLMGAQQRNMDEIVSLKQEVREIKAITKDHQVKLERLTSGQPNPMIVRPITSLQQRQHSPSTTLPTIIHSQHQSLPLLPLMKPSKVRSTTSKSPPGLPKT